MDNIIFLYELFQSINYLSLLSKSKLRNEYFMDHKMVQIWGLVCESFVGVENVEIYASYFFRYW